MTQTTNDQNENEYIWARRPGGSSESPDAATAQAPVAGSTSEFAPPGGSAWAPAEGRSDARTEATAPIPAATSPWAAAGSAPTQAPAPAPVGAPPSADAPHPAPTAPWAADASVPPAPGHQFTPAGSAGLPPAPPSGGKGKSRRERGRPGWGGVLAVGAGAAALSSLLTAGIVLQTQDDPKATTSASSSGGGTGAGAGAAAAVPAPVSGGAGSSPNWGAVAKAVEPSVVAVKVVGQNGDGGEGSGVILDKTGRIVTNNHVVSGVGSGATVTVTLNDGDTYAASVVGTDSATDLAVIKLSNPPSDLTPAVLGSSSTVGVGDPVMAVGNPLGLAGTVTTGIVSATDRPTTTQAESTDPNATGGGDPVVTNAIQTDAAVNPGNSGGALVDDQGRVIGIPSSIASLGSSQSFGGQAASQSGSIGLGFAIPVDEVKDVTSQLIKGGTVAHSYLGVTPADGTVKFNGASRDAAIIKTVQSGTPAQKAGLKVGDAVIAVDGDTVNSDLSLVGQLRERPVNTQVTLTVIRDGKSMEIKVTLGTRPATAG